MKDLLPNGILSGRTIALSKYQINLQGIYRDLPSDADISDSSSLDTAINTIVICTSLSCELLCSYPAVINVNNSYFKGRT